MTINTFKELKSSWSLKLSPRPDAWDIEPVTDGHNAWRNDPTKIIRKDIPGSFPATVPGCIHTDLISAGFIDDISINGKEQDQFWIWKTDSTYSTLIPRDSSDGHKELIFNGLDTIATIRINGEVRLTTKNMHRSYRLDISNEISAGDVQLEVSFKAPLTDAEEHVEELGLYPRPYDMPYNYQRKMACSYGWDWGPITVSSGIWKKVEIHNWSVAYCGHVAVVPTVENSIPQFSLDVPVKGEVRELSARVRVISVEGRNTLIDTLVSIQGSQFVEHIQVPDAQVWHPRGRGAQHLYNIVFDLLDTNDQVLESHTKRVGFRKVELDSSPSVDGKNMFAIKVNGERLWIRGANWIPDDPFPTRVTKERYQQRIKDMLEVNINGIRVWGGGIYESEDFYNFCDEEGIVVWQDFLFACAAYPETPEMFEEVALEVDENVRRLSSHPSLVIWCGGNECLEGFQYWGWQPDLAGRPWGETFYRQTIPNTLKSIDTSRPYIPGSPFSTHSDDVRSFDSGTNHIWDVWNETGYERYEQYQPAFAAEFGFNGPGSWSMLTRAIGSDTLDSTTPEVAYYQRAFDGMTKIAAGLSREFANPPTQGHAWYFAAALDQARAVEIGLKHFRSLYETCSGSILWQFNDMWPAISWAVLDHTGFRKLAWHAMKAAYRPRTLIVGRVDQGAQITLLNDHPEAWKPRVELFLINQVGVVINKHLLEVQLDRYSVFRTPATEIFPEIANGQFEGFILATHPEVRVSRRTTLNPAAAAPAHDLEHFTEIVDGKLRVDVTAKTYIHELSILPEILHLGTQIDSQNVSLLPGENHIFTVTGPTDALLDIAKNVDTVLWSHNRIVNQS
jgi:beta-mannosidase|uniref:glycoside hydrolase family 2 protein n=1 Tax=Candidatus Planktophila sp. TaxID=2175601 RepID=UPI00404AA72C